MTEKQKLKRNKVIKFVVVFIIWFISGLQMSKSPDNTFWNFLFLVSGIMGFVILFKKVRTKEEKLPKFTLQMQEKYKPIGGFRHVYLRQRGLPSIIKEVTFFDFFLCEDKIVIISEPYEIVIPKEDLKDIRYEYIPGGRVQHLSNGSLAGSMVGESMFGTPGAISGAMPRVSTSVVSSDTNMYIRYRSKDNVIKELYFNSKGSVKDYKGIVNFCKETYKRFLAGEELQNGQITL